MINKIDLYKYYRPSTNLKGIDLSSLTSEQMEAFKLSQDKANIQDKINYLYSQYNNIKSLNTMSPLYRECKAKRTQTDTLIRIESEINKLKNQLNDINNKVDGSRRNEEES